MPMDNFSVFTVAYTDHAADPDNRVLIGIGPIYLSHWNALGQYGGLTHEWIGAGSPVADQWNMQGFIRTAGSSQFRSNGANYGAPIVHTINTGSNQLTLGGDGWGSPYMQRSQIAEVIVYNRVLDVVERQQVESYLWWKWMQSMPPFPTTGLQLWLDASDAATFSYSSGSVVSEWRDKSGNSRHGTGIGNRDGVINGLAAVRFAYNNFLSFASFASPLTSAEVFIVLKLNAETYNGAPFGGWGTDASDSHYTFGGTIYEGWGTTTRKTLGDPAPDLFVPHLYNLRTAPGSYVAEINGGPLFSAGNTVAFRNNAHYIPRETASIEGLIAEIAMYNRVLDSVERGQVESYLGTKWGITLL